MVCCFLQDCSFVFIHLVIFIFKVSAAATSRKTLLRPLLCTSTTAGIVIIFDTFLSSGSVPAAPQVVRVRSCIS